MTFTVGMTCKTRDGRDARVICVDRQGGNLPIVALVMSGGLGNDIEGLLSFSENGKYEEPGENAVDLLPPKRGGTFWDCVFADKIITCQHSEGEAERMRRGRSGCLAIKRVDWTEGDGLPAEALAKEGL